MPGKAYTFKELKQIVDYLAENKLYAEVKGRRMWMDLANSRGIDRTWQSLKETFLKRILPDIHNPYYKLTTSQIMSFSSGYDHEERERNKLEIITANKEVKKAEGGNGKSSSDKDKEGSNSGEDIKLSKKPNLDRSSTDTLVLDPIEQDNIGDEPKKLRDLISYSEPLTPMLQEVLDDFASDEDEPPLQIVENTEGAVKPEAEKRKSPSPEVQSQSLLAAKPALESKTDEKTTEKSMSSTQKIKSLKLKRTRKGDWENKVTDSSAPEDSPKKSKPKEDTQTRPYGLVEANLIEILSGKTQRTDVSNSNISNDTPLPNNQEALETAASTKNTIDISNTDTQLTQEKAKEKPKDNSKSDIQLTQNKVKVKPNKKTEKETSKTDTKSKPKNKPDKKSDNVDKTEYEPTIIDLDTPDDIQDKSNNSIPNTNEDEFVSKDKSKVTNENEVIEAVQSTDSVVLITNNSSEINPCLQSVSLYDEQFSTTKYTDSESDKEAKNQKSKKSKKETAKQDSTKVNKPDKNTKSPEKNDKIEVKTKPAKIPSKTNPNDGNIENHEEKKRKSKNSDQESVKQDTSKVNKQNKNTKSIEKNVNNDVKTKPAKVASMATSKDDNTKNDNQNSKGAQLNGETSPPKKVNVDSDIHNEVTCVSSNGSDTNISKNSVDEIELKDGDNLEIHPVPGTSRKANSQRDKVLANMFGFNSGHVSKQKISKRPRSRNFTKSSDHANHVHGSESSEYSTLSDDSEFESQDCSVKHLKPYNILSHSGALCVIENNKVYPIVKRHRKGGLRYVTGWPEVEEEGDEYWQTKYMEEKIRADELAKLLHRAKETVHSISSDARSTSPILPLKPIAPIEPIPPAAVAQEPKKTEEIKGETTFKVKFAENHEIEIKCSAQSVQPVLEKLSEMFRKKEPEVPQAPQLLSSGTTTPVLPVVDSAVREKVDKMEEEIFKEIEELAKEDSSAQEENVTKRKRGRPNKDQSPSVSSVNSVSKKAKLSGETAATRKSERVGSHASVTYKRSVRTPKKYNDANAQEATPKKTAPSKRNPKPIRKEVEIPEDDSKVRYKFPDDSSSTISGSRSRSKINEKNSSKSYKNPRIFSSPDDFNTSESALGYQDSDVSIQIVRLKRRRSSSSSVSSRRSTYKSKARRPDPYLADDDTVDADPSIEGPSINVPNSSLDTVVYRSDSYQLLMPKIKSSTSRLDKIDEFTAADTYTSGLKVTVDNYDVITGKSSPRTDGNSSSVSLPLSPELSLVENISVNKEFLSSLDGPTINEMQCNKITEATDLNKYTISDVNVSVPLMQQDCELRENKRQLSLIQKNTISESMLTKIGSVNMEEQSSSDSLDLKLRALLLESAQKIAHGSSQQPMDVDPNTAQKKKSRAKKRCSTPCKKAVKKPVDPVLEQHVESCSYSGRKSCPPIINIIQSEPIQPTPAKPVKIQRKKKDIIRVKITRPSKSPKKKRARSNSRSRLTDSGINDTESDVFLHVDDSIELIHNHSETCIFANECINESVEFIENKTVSIVAVDSNSVKPDQEVVREMVTNELLAEMFCSNAQDVANSDAAKSLTSCTKTVHSSPNNNSFNSLITDDLSEESTPKSPTPFISKVSKWFLVSDEDFTNSNFVDAQSQDPPYKSYGANLNEIFLPCAVPNLSTITENSKDNNYNRKLDTPEKQVVD